jgi:hypothetical protein
VPHRSISRKADSQGADRYQATRRRNFPGDIIMGKYLVGWLLGVPVFVLVILYFFFH